MSEPPYHYQAARHLADITDVDDELTAIEGALMCAAAHDSLLLDPSTLAELTPALASQRQYRELLYLLKEADVIAHGGVRFAEIRSIFDAARVFAERGEIPTNKVVANHPLDEDEFGDSIGSLVVNLLELIQQAESELVILNPFFSERGYEQVGAPIADATTRGVDVTLVTKSLTYGGSTQNERVMRKLFQDEDTVQSNIELYEYVLDEDPEEDHPPTIHAKLTISDGERAYLGTANMTHRGLVENLELGVIFRDDTVDLLLGLVMDLLSSEYLHPVQFTPSGFDRE